MVKIQTRNVTKKYRDKVYSYKQHVVILPIPSNGELAPFLDKQLCLKIKDDAAVAGETEQGVFAALDLPCPLPSEREIVEGKPVWLLPQK